MHLLSVIIWKSRHYITFGLRLAITRARNDSPVISTVIDYYCNRRVLYIVDAFAVHSRFQIDESRTRHVLNYIHTHLRPVPDDLWYGRLIFYFRMDRSARPVRTAKAGTSTTSQ